LLFYEVFITVIISTVVLYLLAQVYNPLRDKKSTSKWWGRGLKILSIIFGVIGFVYLSIGPITWELEQKIACRYGQEFLESLKHWGQ
jgi:predicted PurR-regulated permease PerM